MQTKQEKAFQELIEMSEKLDLYRLDWIENPLIRDYKNDDQLDDETEEVSGS